MIITINSTDLTNVMQNTSIADRTYKLQMLNEFLRKGELNIRYTFLVKPVGGDFFPVYPMLNFYASDNAKDQDINSAGVLSIAQPEITPQFTTQVFSTSEDFDPDIVYYYPFSNGNNLLGPTPRADLVPNNISFQYGTGPFAGVSSIDITSAGGYFELPRKLQVSSLEQNWGFSIFLNNNSSNFRILRIRKQDERNIDANETPRFAVTMTTSGQIRIIAVNEFDQWVIDWLSTTSIPLAQWGHLLLSFSETGHRVYINGVEDLGTYTRGTQNTIFDFSDLLPFDINRFRLADNSQASFAQVTWYKDTVTAAEAGQMQINTFPYTTSDKVAFHYPLDNSLQPSSGYNLLDYTNGQLTYSSSVSKLNDGNGSALVYASGISSLPQNHAPFMGLDDYSISFWFRTQTHTQNLFRLWGNRITIALLSNGALEFSIRTNNQHSVRIRSLVNYTNSEWHHVCFSISTTQGNRVYVNGVLLTVYNVGNQNVKFINTSDIISSTDEEISYLLGEAPGPNGTYFSDYALWNTFFSSQETVSAIYQGTYNYQVSYSIPTGQVTSYGGGFVHKTPCHKTQTIQLRRPSDRVRVRLGSTGVLNPDQIENYILTLYINE